MKPFFKQIIGDGTTPGYSINFGKGNCTWGCKIGRPINAKELLAYFKSQYT